MKKLKRDNEDDMLHYIKYSHLENIPETDFIIDIKEYKNKATQHPDIRNRSTQTHKMDDKATDTLDDLHKIDYKYKVTRKIQHDLEIMILWHKLMLYQL